MNIPTRLRQFHRWMSLAFTVAAIANIIAVVRGQPAQWLGLLAVIPLIPLMLTGLYMFVRPYVSQRDVFQENQVT